MLDMFWHEKSGIFETSHVFWDLPLLGDDELFQTIIHNYQWRQTKLKHC